MPAFSAVQRLLRAESAWTIMMLIFEMLGFARLSSLPCSRPAALPSEITRHRSPMFNYASRKMWSLKIPAYTTALACGSSSRFMEAAYRLQTSNIQLRLTCSTSNDFTVRPPCRMAPGSSNNTLVGCMVLTLAPWRMVSGPSNKILPSV